MSLTHLRGQDRPGRWVRAGPDGCVAGCAGGARLPRGPAHGPLKHGGLMVVGVQRCGVMVVRHCGKKRRDRRINTNRREA